MRASRFRSLTAPAPGVHRGALLWARFPALVPSGLTVPAAVLVAVAVRLPLLAGGQVDYDEGVYWQTLRALAAGEPLFSGVYSSQPPAFLLLVLPFHLLSGGALLAGRATVLLLSILGLLAAYRGVTLLADRRVALLAVALLAADPLFMRQSVTLQADGPALALALISLALAVEGRLHEGRLSGLLAASAGAVLAVAILTKLLAVAAAPALAVLLLRRTPGTEVAAAARRSAAAGFGAAAAAAACLLPYAGGLPALWEQTIGLHLQARHSALGGVPPDVLLAELPIVALGVAGAYVGRRHASALAMTGVTWSVAAILVLALHRPLWPHHLLILVVPLVLLAGSIAVRLHRLGPAPTVLAALVLILASVAAALQVHRSQTPDASRLDAVTVEQAATAAGDLTITDDQYTVALAGRRTPPPLVDTSQVRVQSGELTTAQVATVADRWHVSCVLVDDHYGSLGAMPGFREWVAQRYPVAHRLGHGRTLYVRGAPARAATGAGSDGNVS